MGGMKAWCCTEAQKALDCIPDDDPMSPENRHKMRVCSTNMVPEIREKVPSCVNTHGHDSEQKCLKDLKEVCPGFVKLGQEVQAATSPQAKEAVAKKYCKLQVPDAHGALDMLATVAVEPFGNPEFFAGEGINDEFNWTPMV